MPLFRSTCLAGVLALTAWTAWAETPAQTKKKGGCNEPPVAFKFVSIHARESLYEHLDGYTNEGFSMTGATFREVIGSVFSTDRIEGLPGWAQHDRYDVIAEIKPDDCCQWSNESDEQESLAVRLMLAHQLKLKWHIETRMVSAYSLVVGKSGTKLVPLPPENKPTPEQQQMGFFTSEWHGAGSMKELAEYLSTEMGHPVVDNTGLTSRYPIYFQMPYDSSYSNRLIEPDGTPSPVPVTASFAQLAEATLKNVGLELKSEKIPLDFLVIDQIERPLGD